MASVNLRHYGRVLPNGNIVFYQPELWTQQRESLAGKDFELTIKEKHKRPSVSQFSYYFGGILATCLTCEQFSHYTTVEEIHEQIFKPLFLSYSVMVIVGKKKWQKTCVKSLTELSKQETSEFIENVLNFCAQEGIEILPAEQYTDKFYREINANK